MFPQIDAEKTTDSHRFFELIYRTFISVVTLTSLRSFVDFSVKKTPPQREQSSQRITLATSQRFKAPGGAETLAATSEEPG